MSKKTTKTSITAATHRLTLEIAKPHAAVWKAFTSDVQSWWPKDFYATESPKRMVFEVKPGGRLYEDGGEGNGLVWYHVIAVDAPQRHNDVGVHCPAVWGAGHIASASGIFRPGEVGHVDGGNRFHLRLPGRSEEHQEGWRMLFEGGFKAWVERK